MTHVPVMTGEVLGFLSPLAKKVYVDCTLGLGGHSEAIMKATGGRARLIAIDRDPHALRVSAERLRVYGDSVTLVRSDFRRLEEILHEQGLRGADGIIFDLGVSSPQLDEPSRGFSYLHDAPLDMRMDPTLPKTAADILNSASPHEIERIIREYGEERWARRIAQFVERERVRAPISTTAELVEVIKAAIPARARRTGPHPAKRTFQALRIAVNDELGAVKSGVEAAIRCLNPGGIVCVISFHSLEDRIVKHSFKSHLEARVVEIVTRKPVVPKETEVLSNPRARSAKLRAARKVLKAGEVE